VGRVPNTDALNLSVIDVDVTEKGFIEVNEVGQTSNPNIYAIGDVTKTPMLAHVASLEAERAIDAIAGIAPRPYPLMLPSAIYTEPQVAGFGLRESADEPLPENASVAVFPLSGAGKSIAVSAPEGFVKILSDTDTQEILGAHIVGHNATEMIHELLLTAVSELLPEDVTNTVHAHPTLSEANQEAMRAVLGRAYHS
jgi:dihydrolipoamide dehydrogenase